MTKILYVIGNGSRNNNQELKWSLRSLDKYVVDDIQPVIVGTVPEWFKGDAVECQDPTDRKAKNIEHKIEVAIDKKLVEGRFQVSSDDHFWMRPVQLEKLPICWRQSVLPKWDGKGNNYDAGLAGTRELLLGCGYSAINTSCHINHWADSNDLPAVWQVTRRLNNAIAGGAWYSDQGLEDLKLADKFGINPAAMWPNLMIGSGRPDRLRVAYRPDIKFGNIDGEELEKYKNRACISINDDAFLSRAFIALMEEKFSGKSRWEK